MITAVSIRDMEMTKKNEEQDFRSVTHATIFISEIVEKEHRTLLEKAGGICDKL